MVEFRETVFHYPDKILFQNLSCRFADGQIHTLIGPSGCGKTTLLYLAAGLLSPREGSVTIRNEPVRRGRRNTAVILQDHGLFPWKNAGENVALGMTLRKQKNARTEAIRYLEELGLEGMEKRYPREMSGGERQRLAVARALAIEPDLLLLDEPFASLDAMTREKLQNRLRAVQNRRRLTMILITHSIEEAVFLGDTIHLMDKSGGLTALPNERHPDQHRSTRSFFEQTVAVREQLEAAGI